MKVFINDDPKEVEENCSLESLRNDLGLQNSKGWAIALNESIVTQDMHPTTFLSDGDRIILIQATQGG